MFKQDYLMEILFDIFEVFVYILFAFHLIKIHYLALNFMTSSTNLIIMNITLLSIIKSINY